MALHPLSPFFQAKMATLMGPDDSLEIYTRLNGTFEGNITVGSNLQVLADSTVFGNETVYGTITASGNVKTNGGLQQLCTAYAADGALTISGGFAMITKAGVAALTLATPAVGDDGKEITLIDTTGNAHVLTSVVPFNAGANTIATFNGTKGSYIRFVIYDQKIWVLGSSGVTLS